VTLRVAHLRLSRALVPAQSGFALAGTAGRIGKTMREGASPSTAINESTQLGCLTTDAAVVGRSREFRSPAELIATVLEPVPDRSAVGQAAAIEALSPPMSVIGPDPPDLGPLAPLIGEWEGDRGTDDSYVYARGREESSRFRERSSFTPAGPAHNGAQSLYRLDYTTTAWRLGEEIPFHTEIGYWFWDTEHEMIMRGLITPRGIVVLAGGSAQPGDTKLTVSADVGAEGFGILSNPHLTGTARTTQFRMTVDLSRPDQFSYEQQTFMYQPRREDLYCHRDRNTLVRV